MNITDLEKIKKDLTNELSVGGFLWEFAVVKGIIQVNEDGTNNEEQTEYLESFDTVHQITTDSIVFKNSFDDMFSVPLDYCHCPEARTNLISKLELYKAEEKQRLIEKKQERESKEKALQNIKELAETNGIDIELS